MNVRGGTIQVECHQPRFEATLSEIFTLNPSRFVVTSGQDVTEGLEVGSQKWLDHILREELYATSLGGRVVP